MLDLPENKYLSREMHSLLALMPKVGVAVSGGSDSVAMLHILVDLLGADRLVVLHFDHNLRDESSDDARWVRNLSDSLGVSCEIGIWSALPEGNVMEQARKARYAFFKEQISEKGLLAVCVGHTEDDVAETFLMRLGKGSGLQGLSAMKEVSDVFGFTVIRPLLGMSRDALMDVLGQKNQSYLSDPSNENPKFQRPRVRQLKASLEAAGVPFKSVAASAKSLSRAHDALECFVDVVCKHTISHEGDVMLLDFKKLAAAPEEIRLKLLARVIRDISGGDIPRTSKRQRLLKGMLKVGCVATLGGVRFERLESHIVCAVEKA